VLAQRARQLRGAAVWRGRHAMAVVSCSRRASMREGHLCCPPTAVPGTHRHNDPPPCRSRRRPPPHARASARGAQS
jgi:hypothetical protein